MKITKTFNVVVHGKQFELCVEDDSRARCFELVDGERGPEVASNRNFSEWLWRRHPKECIAAEKLRLVAVELQPSAIPLNLEKLLTSDELVFRDACNQYDIITTAKNARKLVQEAIERRQAGVINIHEAAAMLARSDGGPIREYVSMLQDAACDGHLELVSDDRPMRAIDTNARADFLTKNGLVSKAYVSAFVVTTLAGVNRCLDRIDTLGVIARLPNTAPTTGQAGPSQIDVIHHSISRPHRDGLWVAIEEAQRRSKDPLNTSEVWVHMIDLANAEYPPLLMVIDNKIKHTARSKFFTKDALDKRLHPEKRKSPTNRR